MIDVEFHLARFVLTRGSRQLYMARLEAMQNILKMTQTVIMAKVN